MTNSLLHDVALPFKHFVPDAPAPAASGVREVPIKEAKATLTELIRAAEAGERIVLTRHGKPVADLVPHQATVVEKPMSLMDRYEAYHKANPRKGIGWVADDFDDPLPEDFLLQPFPDDFDEKLAAANNRARESKGG